MPRHFSFRASALLFLFAGLAFAADEEESTAKSTGTPVSKDFTIETWSGQLPVPEPVAVTVAPDGTVFVTQTERRKIGDLDIREHTDWIPKDVALDSIEAKSRFYKEDVLAIGRQGAVKDLNQDGAKDWRDLTVPTERIWRYRDTKNAGIADERIEFASGFNNEVTGIAAGILWHQGSIFTTIAPDFWKLTDKDNDGKADERESLAHGFGMHIAYAGHDMHGPRVGPDGMIYWTIGDKGVHVTSKEGRVFHYPHRGCLMRCDPDGSNFEVVATGLRNTQEIVFDEYGNIFGEDNDADKPGERERLLYIVEGGDYGWQCAWQYRGKEYDPWLAEHITGPRHPGQPAWVLPAIAYGHGGPAGFAYNPGTALGPRWERTFFSAQFTGTGKISAFQMEPDGAGFKVVNDRPVCEGVQAVDFAWGPNGKLYCADWEGGYDMNHVGYIRTLDVAGGTGVPPVSGSGHGQDARATQESAADPRRAETQALLQSGMKGREQGELVKLMAFPDMRVRMAAQFELAARKSSPLLLETVVNKKADRMARIHSMWGLSQIARLSKSEMTLPLDVLSISWEGDSEIRAQFAKLCLYLPIADFSTAMEQLLKDRSPRVRFFAAMTMGKKAQQGKITFSRDVGSEAYKALPGLLLDLIINNKDADIYLRHAGVFAWSHLYEAKNLEIMALLKSPVVHRATVLTMRRLDSPLVLTFAGDEDVAIQTEAIAAYHDRNFNDPKPFAPEPLAAALDNTDFVLKLPAGAQRRILNANLRSSAAAAPARLAKYAALATAPLDLRNEALALLAMWEKPRGLDRVTGQHIIIDSAGRSRETVAEAVVPVLPQLEQDRKIALGVLRLKNALGGSSGPSGMSIARDAKQSLEIRLAALQEETSNIDKDEKPALDLAADASQPAALRGLALQLASMKHAAKTEPLALAHLLQPASEDVAALIPLRQAAYQVAGRAKSDAFDVILVHQLSDLAEGKFAPALALDLLEAAFQRAKASPAVKSALKAVEKISAEQVKTNPSAAYAECLQGGDATNGEDIFLQNANAGCIRCHSNSEVVGTLIGPNLHGIANRADRAYLLQSLVDPAAKIAEGFGMITFILRDGKAAAGIIAKEDAATVTLRLADNSTQEIPASDINTRTPPITLMPPMQGILSKREIRDVVEYLASLKK